jgi:hypothetical protein
MNVYNLERGFQIDVALSRNEEQPMLQFTEKILPPSRPEIFNDGTKVDAVSEKQEKEDHWVKEIVANLAGFLRKTGK